ncbi:MAG: DUF362 domain-containing protein [Candidatus Aminicenantes bacterium]
MASEVFYIPAHREEADGVLAGKAEKIFLKLGFHQKIEPGSLVACKIHFGEKGNTGHIKPPWLLNVIKKIREKTERVFLTDSNTLYLGERSNAIQHLRLAWEHGFTMEEVGIPVFIADGLVGRDEEEIQVNLDRIKSAKIARAFLNTDSLLCLTHFTGHVLTGFGASIKNLGMGCAARTGKLEQHSDVHPWINPKLCKNCGLCIDYCPTQAIVEEDGTTSIIDEKCIGCGECLVVCNLGAVKMRWDADSTRVQEKMAEYAFSVWQRFKGKIGFLNFLIKVTKDCDCMGKNQPSFIKDIGILGSKDPVAIDRASVDLVNGREDRDLLRAENDVDWSVQLKHGEKIRLGTTDYELIEIG